MSGIWIVGLAAAALLVALIAIVEKARKRSARSPGGSAPSAVHQGSATSWVAGGAVAGSTAWWPGQSQAHDNDSPCDNHSSSYGGCGGCSGCGGCGGCGG
ncbi:hypothetical protein [Streptomyces sp. NPDC048442]|uniref:hypothetical protein n=1 Tax=Streptomyces sp. NPDC048442 TaxID=3154823 RepID=UPI00343A574D